LPRVLVARVSFIRQPHGNFLLSCGDGKSPTFRFGRVRLSSQQDVTSLRWSSYQHIGSRRQPLEQMKASTLAQLGDQSVTTAGKPNPGLRGRRPLNCSFSKVWLAGGGGGI